MTQSHESTKEPDDDRIDAPTDSEIKSFAAYWHSKSSDTGIPARADFPVDEMKPWLGRLILMEVIDDGADFRYRLVGTEIAEANGRDLTGKCISESQYAGRRSHVLATFRDPVTARRPIFRQGHMIWAPNKAFRRYESVHCPLAGNGTDIDMTIGLHVYIDL